MIKPVNEILKMVDTALEGSDEIIVRALTTAIERAAERGVESINVYYAVNRHTNNDEAYFVSSYLHYYHDTPISAISGSLSDFTRTRADIIKNVLERFAKHGYHIVYKHYEDYSKCGWPWSKPQVYVTDVLISWERT